MYQLEIQTNKQYKKIVMFDPVATAAITHVVDGALMTAALVHAVA